MKLEKRVWHPGSLLGLLIAELGSKVNSIIYYGEWHCGRGNLTHRCMYA